VTFGSIDDVSAPISSSPIAVPPTKSEGVRTFGSMPVVTGHVNGKPSISSRASIAPPTASSPLQHRLSYQQLHRLRMRSPKLTSKKCSKVLRQRLHQTLLRIHRHPQSGTWACLRSSSSSNHIKGNLHILLQIHHNLLILLRLLSLVIP
jgi:hypothetical protein